METEMGNDVDASEGIPKVTSNHEKLAEASKDFSLGLSEGAWPSRHLDFGLLVSGILR